MKHLEYNNILYDLQHGFRSSRSCETQLVSFIQDLAKSSDKNIQTDLIIMDFAKAFDKVSHKHLMYKISYYGINCNAFHWISFIASSLFFICLYMMLSSANNRRVLCWMYSARSFMNMRNNIGPSTVP
jgi:hypothetical protein